MVGVGFLPQEVGGLPTLKSGDISPQGLGVLPTLGVKGTSYPRGWRTPCKSYEDARQKFEKNPLKVLSCNKCVACNFIFSPINWFQKKTLILSIFKVIIIMINSVSS